MVKAKVEHIPYESPLVKGLIAAHTACPFKKACVLVEDCDHKGPKHATSFSCAAARVQDKVAALSHKQDMLELQRTRSM